jgi:hypothetical protein
VSRDSFRRALTQSSIDLLNQLMDIAVSTQGAYGVKLWLIEVQAFTRQLQKRILAQMPLLPHERHAVVNFVAYWRNAMHPAVSRRLVRGTGGPETDLQYGMATPEAQIVLIALMEFASM